ncbi:hypothetical protein LX32DRAFT_167955 [Colletotrichum zoysiae]|uniref:Maltose/galactoside acetyltransferase domain-containing protein n=1 Tax=Colletotrichum zoysiae TaxID=1216348 RepID=A0AAD9HQP3_9PEZI|nr:hypothetical protein LX32DRAFT_167955 [Colletotrichum zoysiae]
MRFTHTHHVHTQTGCSRTQQSAMNTHSIDREENRRRMRDGELYWAFTPDLIADRKRCKTACDKLNTAGDVSRRTLVGLWKDINGDTIPLPPLRVRRDEDNALLENYPWIETPIKMDYGYNARRKRLHRLQQHVGRHLPHHGGLTHHHWSQLLLLQRRAPAGPLPAQWHPRTSEREAHHHRRRLLLGR